MPVLASLLLPRKIEEREPLLMRLAHRIHAPILRLCMHHKLLVIGFALGVLVVAFGMIAPNLGSEFVPRLSEGAIVINVVRLAGTDLDESIRANTQMEKAILKAFPDEVRARLEPHRHRRSRDRPDGRGTDRHVHHAQAARHVEEGPHPGGTHRADREGPAGNARPAALVLAADRAAHQRDDVRRALGRGGQALRRRFPDA